MKNISNDLFNKITNPLQTVSTNANPQIALTVVRAKDAVIDNSYWTVEKIREKNGLGDLSIAAKRVKSFGGPNRLYNIYIDNGIVKTAIREYPDYNKNKWIDQFELGSGNAVAIAFDGHWEFTNGRWQMATSEEPWLFWANNGILWAQYWDDISTKIQLASEVVKVKSLRAWKNANISEIDQGLVASYIKSNGKLFYRTYAYQSDGSFSWETERELTALAGTYNTHNMFLTNDYRMGITAERIDGSIDMIITSRAWAGMAIAPEKFHVRASAKATHILLNYIRSYETEKFTVSASSTVLSLYASPVNNFISVEQVSVEDLGERFADQGNLNYGQKLCFVVKQKILTFDTNDFELRDADNVRFRCTGIIQIDEYIFECVFEDFNNAVGNITLKNLGTVATNEAGYLFGEFSFVFTPNNLVPEAIDPPEVEVIWNE